MNIRKNIKSENGITLIALTVMVIILLILASVTVSAGINGYKTAKEDSLLSELNMIQHAIMERYSKSQITGETLPGEDVDKTQVVQLLIDNINTKTGTNISLKGQNYKRLRYNKEENIDDLSKLGITNRSGYSYIVNYATGEVINETKLFTDYSKTALYIYSKTSE